MTISSARIDRRRLPIGALALSALIVVSACGTQPPAVTNGPSGVSAPSASTAAASSNDAAGIVAPSLLPYDQVTAVDAAQAEVEEVDRLRREAGIAALIGPAGPAVLKNIDEAKVAHAEKTLPLIAKDLGLELSAGPPRIASVQGAPSVVRRDDLEWSGSLVGQVSATATMVMALLPPAIPALADGPSGKGTLEHPETYTKEAHDGVKEVIKINTKYRISVSPPKVSLDLDINSVDTITDATTGKEIARLEGSAHGHIDVNACPDANGLSEGSYELVLQEALVQPGSASAGSAKVFRAPFKLIDGDDAYLVRIEANLELDKHAHGPGTPGGDPGSPFEWSVSASIPEVIPAGGNASVAGATARTDGNATQAQVSDTINSHLSVDRYLQVVAKATESFWRSGKCIDLKTNEESRKVDPEEKITLKVDAVHKYDGQQVKAPITATFTGKESLDPSGKPLDPPASFDFKAGKDPKDKGTVDLKQTSKRGIAKKQLVFTVDPGDIDVSITGTFHEGDFTARFTIPQTRLKAAADGAFTPVTIQLQMRVTVSGQCSGSGSFTFPSELGAKVDQSDSQKVRLRVVPAVSYATVKETCGNAIAYTPVISPLTIWLSAVVTQLVGKDAATEIRGIGNSTATVTVHPAK